MKHAIVRSVLASALTSALVLGGTTAEAKTRSFVTLSDDGSLAKKLESPSAISKSIMAKYKKAGLPLPDVLSVWTSFPMGGGDIETRFIPLSNDVTGINLESAYGGDGTMESSYAPTRSILLHNDVTAFERRATVQGATLDGFGRYIFLLELSHNWGPQVRLPTEGGAAENGLIGFDFHWSFWMDAGGSPAGGNAWTDNGNGTFSASGQSMSKVQFSMLDLYLMGLATPDEVPPFGLLEKTVAPKDMLDPSFGGTPKPYAARSFPYWGEKALTVQATRRTITIDDIIAANGSRSPLSWDGKLTLGIVLMTSASATSEEIAAAEATFEPTAASLAPAFKDATRGRGTMTLVTESEVADTSEAPPGSADTTADPPPPAPTAPASSTSGCAFASAPAEAPISTIAIVAAALVMARRRRRWASRI